MAASLTAIYDEGAYAPAAAKKEGLSYVATLNLGTYATGGVADDAATKLAATSGGTPTILARFSGASVDSLNVAHYDGSNDKWIATVVENSNQVANAVDLSAAAKHHHCIIAYSVVPA